MAIAVRCPGCGRAYKLTERLAGQAVRCTDCNAAFTVPVAIAPAEPAAPPQYDIGPAPVSSHTAAPPAPLRPVPRKQKNSLMPLIAGIAACGLLAMVLVGGLLVWGIYSAASGLSFPLGSSNAEQVIQKMLAKMREVNALLAQVVDVPTHERLQGPIFKAWEEYAVLAGQLDVAARTISRSEDRRLTSLYLPQLTSEKQVAEAHWARIHRLGKRLKLEEQQRQLDELTARFHQTRPAPAAPPAVQPPQAVPFQPPTFQPPPMPPPPTIPRPSIPKPSIRHHLGR